MRNWIVFKQYNIGPSMKIHPRWMLQYQILPPYSQERFIMLAHFRQRRYWWWLILLYGECIDADRKYTMWYSRASGGFFKMLLLFCIELFSNTFRGIIIETHTTFILKESNELSQVMSVQFMILARTGSCYQWGIQECWWRFIRNWSRAQNLFVRLVCIKNCEWC